MDLVSHENNQIIEMGICRKHKVITIYNGRILGLGGKRDVLLDSVKCQIDMKCTINVNRCGNA